MNALLIVLGLATLGLAGVAVWLAMGRGRLAAEAAAAREAKAEIEGRAAELAARLEEERAVRAGVERQVAELSAEVDKAAQGHALEEKRMRDLHAQQVGAIADERARSEARLREQIGELNKKFEETFRSLATEALKSSREDFFALAKKTFDVEREKSAAEVDKRKAAVDELIKPIGETLKKTDAKLAEMEKTRTESATAISEQLKAAAEANQFLRMETGKLVRALREPHVRGRYGEIQLKRVAELAGMQAYCDFREQDFSRDGEGQAMRPDMIVRLPSERVVIVDAKCNIQAYLDALQAATPEEADGHLDRFARHVADQASALAKKKYWSLADYDGSPEFVVMFIPGDNFIDAALARQPEILENAARQGVILASPSTLIGLLRAVSVGYKEQRVAKEASELRELGVQFHERACAAFGHLAKLGKALEGVVEKYNDYVGSYQGRLEPTLRRFEDAGVKSGKELADVSTVTVRARLVEAGSADVSAGA